MPAVVASPRTDRRLSVATLLPALSVTACINFIRQLDISLATPGRLRQPRRASRGVSEVDRHEWPGYNRQQLPPWWNWHTHQVEGLCPFRACWFESSRGHLRVHCQMDCVSGGRSVCGRPLLVCAVCLVGLLAARGQKSFGSRYCSSRATGPLPEATRSAAGGRG